MSVSLINPELGNFDNVFMLHKHYTRDILYQLCRFLFNYEKWDETSVETIKTTKIHSISRHVIDSCLEYEQHVEHLCNDFMGKSCSLREVMGLEPLEPTEKEVKQHELSKVKLVDHGGKVWKKFKVYDGNDEEQWDLVMEFYRSIKGKVINKRSMPKKQGDFWVCSDSGGRGIKTISDILLLEKEKWYSRFQLMDGVLSYAKIFVAYETDNIKQDEYTIFVKFIQFENTQENRDFLRKYGKNKV
jgi:hypothetical protein